MSHLKETTIFDQYSRYKRLAEIIKKVSKDETIEILDIGSGLPCLLEKFIPEYKITFLDPQLEDGSTSGQNKVSGDLWSKNFLGRKFDLVVTCDTYEHIPPNERREFLLRLMDLARTGILMGCPFQDAGEGLSTDIYVNDFYKLFMGKDFNWLEEHFSNGLPSLSRTLEFFSDQNWHCQIFPNGHTPWMKKLLSYTLTVHDLLPEQVPHLLELSSYFNHHLYNYDHQDPAYRYFIVVTKNKLEPLTFPDHTSNDETKKHWKWIENKMHSGISRLLPQKGSHKIELKQIIKAQSLKPESSDWYIENLEAKKSFDTKSLTVKEGHILCHDFALPPDTCEVHIHISLSLELGKSEMAMGSQLNWKTSESSFISYGVPEVNMSSNGAIIRGKLSPPPKSSSFTLKIIAPKGKASFLLEHAQIAFLKS
jgi:hypothetical protein